MDKKSRRSIDVVLAEAQARLRRLSPVEAAAAISEGWTLVDTRDGEVMARDGAIPGALCIALSSPVAKAGSSSSAATASPRASPQSACTKLGFTETTDVIGGFGAWVAAGHPVER